MYCTTSRIIRFCDRNHNEFRASCCLHNLKTGVNVLMTRSRKYHVEVEFPVDTITFCNTSCSLFCSLEESYDNADLRHIDGLSSLNYTLIERVQNYLFTKVTVDMTGPKYSQDSEAYFHQKVKEIRKKLFST